MKCPACGAGLDELQRFTRLAVCRYCDSAIVLDEEAARIAGKMAVLAPPASGLHVGATGRLEGKSFEVLGRVRYGYGSGYWDEWFLLVQGRDEVWLSEDEDSLAVEELVRLDRAPEWDATSPGDHVEVGDRRWYVNERDVAHCEGGEGQLPFVVEQGEEVRYLDLASVEDGESGAFGTLELDDEGAKLFVGRRLEPADLKIDLTAEEAGVGDTLASERAAGGTGKRRVVKDSSRARVVKCSACNSPLDVPADHAEPTIECPSCRTLVDLDLEEVRCPGCQASAFVRGGDDAKALICPYCRGQLDLTAGSDEPKLLGSLADARRPKLPFDLGARCHLKGADWVFVGHLEYRGKDGAETWRWQELLLHNPDRGYVYLIFENGHWSWCEEIEERPKSINPKRLKRGSGLTFLNTRWWVYEKYDNNCVVTWVDGELPWVASLGDNNSYLDAVKPPRMLSAEWTDSEMEWYLAEYLDPAEVAEAFQVPLGHLPARTGVQPHQLYEISDFRRQAIPVMGMFAALFVGLLIWAGSARGHERLSWQLQPAEYAVETLSPTFRIEREDALCKVGFRSPVDNAWVYLDCALVDAGDHALCEFSAECSYYHGVEGGESWSEGSQSDELIIKVEEPGDYRLLVLGEAGAGNSLTGIEHGQPITITVREGVRMMRYFGLGLLFCILWLSVEGIAYMIFASARRGED